MPDEVDPKKGPRAKPRASSPPGGSRSRSSRRPDDDPLAGAGLDDDAPAEERARPIAVTGSDPSLGPDASAETIDESTASPEDAPGSVVVAEETVDSEAVVERPLIEAAVGVAGLLLALSVVLSDWYQGPFGPISGWSSGNLGPVIFFLGLATAVIVALRALRIRLSFPLETSWILEGIGWIVVVMLMLKRFLIVPEGSRVVGGLFGGWALSLWPAIAIAILAGYTSTSAPLVVRPGWFDRAPGKLAAGILGLALLLGLIFGITVSPPGAPAFEPPPQLQPGTPACARGFPIPDGVTPVNGRELSGLGRTVCEIHLSSSLTSNSVAVRYERLLEAQDIAVQRQSVGATSNVLQLSGDRCGAVQIMRVGERTEITVFLTPCLQEQPTQ